MQKLTNDEKFRLEQMIINEIELQVEALEFENDQESKNLYETNLNELNTLLAKVMALENGP